MKTPARTLAALIFVAAAILVEKMFWSALALPSITSLILIADLLARWTGIPLLGRQERGALLVGAAIGGVILYAGTLAAIPFDCYRWGFSPYSGLAVAIGALIVARSHPGLSVSALIVLIAFDLRLLPSANLFDYLVDPFLTLAALGWCTKRAVTGWKRGRPPLGPSNEAEGADSACGSVGTF